MYSSIWQACSLCISYVLPRLHGDRYGALISAAAECGDLRTGAKYLMQMMESGHTPPLALLEKVGPGRRRARLDIP